MGKIVLSMIMIVISSVGVIYSKHVSRKLFTELQQLQQKNWVEQQKFEKEMKLKQEREEERQYAEQTLSINRAT